MSSSSSPRATAQSLPRLQASQQPRRANQQQDSPLSSVPPSPAFPIAPYGHPPPGSGLLIPSRSSIPQDPSRNPPLQYEYHQELPSKRPASPEELRSPDRRRNVHASYPYSNLPSSSSEAHFTTIPYHNAPAPTHKRNIKSTRDPNVEAERRPTGRPAGRPRRTPANPVEVVLEGPSTSAGQNNAFVPPGELHYAAQSRHYGNSSSSHRRGNVGPVMEPRIFAGPRSPYAHTPIMPWSRASRDRTFGSSSHPNPPPPPFQTYQHMHAPEPISQQEPLQPSPEAYGYTIIRHAISLDLVWELATYVDRGAPIVEYCDTAQTFVTPVHAFGVRDEFLAKWRPALQPFFEPNGKDVPEMPTANTLGSFRPSDPSNIWQSIFRQGRESEVYVHIALTHLGPDNGFFDFLTGSHEARHPARTRVNQWSRTSIELGEGDALIWRGDLSYFVSPRGGGIWQCLTFDLGPSTVDLTGDDEPREGGDDDTAEGRQR